MKMYENNNKFTVCSPGLQSYLRLKILLFLRKKLRRTSPGLQYGPGWNHNRRNIQQGYATNKGNFILKKKQKKMSSLFPPVYFFLSCSALCYKKKKTNHISLFFFHSNQTWGDPQKKFFFDILHIFNIFAGPFFLVG